MSLCSITSEPADCALIVLHIPQEDASIAAYGREGLVVPGDGDVKDGVAVGGVALDRVCGFGGGIT